jgi:hypothetical protein
VLNISLLSWNMKQKASNWYTVLDSKVDAALLQEASAPPDELWTELMLDMDGNWSESGHFWRTAVAGVLKSGQLIFTPIKTQPLGGIDPEALMVLRPGSMAVAVIKIKTSGEEINLVSMCSNWMNPIRQTGSRWIFADASAHRLTSDLNGLVGS